MPVAVKSYLSDEIDNRLDGTELNSSEGFAHSICLVSAGILCSLGGFVRPSEEAHKFTTNAFRWVFHLQQKKNMSEKRMYDAKSVNDLH